MATEFEDLFDTGEIAHSKYMNVTRETLSRTEEISPCVSPSPGTIAKLLRWTSKTPF
jgi:hypothetical protein